MLALALSAMLGLAVALIGLHQAFDASSAADLLAAFVGYGLLLGMGVLVAVLLRSE